ncbi:MAG: YitT family protein [Candidatus Coprenecus sp.]|nr:YitT family protein [Candidatus Coprenecus sp.]
MNKYLKILSTSKFWKELFVMTVGMLIAASAVYYFLMPSKLIVGSISGLAIVISGIFEQMGMVVKVSHLVTIINIILLILAWILIGKEFGAKTFYTAMILGPCIDFWDLVLPYQTLMEPGTTSVMGDIWFDLVCFVLVLSISQALLFNINASTGGLDIIGKIVNKYFHLDIGASVSVGGAIICCSAFAINPFRMVVIGLIGTWINGVIIDYFTVSLNGKKRICIVSDNQEKIRDFICNKLQRGCTIYNVKGGFTGQEHTEIEAIISKNEFAELMEFIDREDLHTFITAGNVSEVYGNWTKKKKRLKF